MIRLAICGVGGRVGAAILARAAGDKGVSLAGLVESKGHRLVGKELEGVVVSSDLGKVIEKCDAVIDFTSPESTLKNAALAAAAKKAMVVGTTGLRGTQKDEFLKTIKPVPVVFSPNMSFGANLLFDVAESLAKLLPDYDVEITEVHHKLKQDAPSGTAQRLAEAIARGRRPGSAFVYGRQGQVGARRSAEIGVHALRGGDVVGDHTVFFFGNGERLELIHRITTREAFATGAVAAAHWVVGRKPGLYDMRDVLGLSDRKQKAGK
ncbi:MAG TPA: 4-hydroxy-tetrahydrodipicolinate reductase [Elusimicrobiota bacterium]|nr:4-hydroxy-tetrahydrodipicolinate reductase [Elusimicrobiota bacterium]